MSEKRHFKLFASKHVKGNINNYVRLFDAIEKQDEYNESQLIKSENYIPDFSVLKTRLYFAVLKSLRAYNTNASLRNKLKAEVDYIEIVQKKGLTDQAKKMHYKAMKKAEDFELWDIWQELFSLEVNIMRAENYKGMSLADINNRFSVYQEVLDKQSETADNLLFEVATFSTFRKLGDAKNLQSEKIFKETLRPFYIENENNLSFSARIRNYQAKAVFNIAILNYTNASMYREKILVLMEQHHQYVEKHPSEYAKCIYNYTLSLVLANKYSTNIFTYLNKLKQIKFDSEKERKQYLMTALFIELCTYCYLGEFEKGLLLIDAAKKQDWIHLEKRNEYIEIINIGIYYFIAYTYFGAGEFKQCNKYLNAIINYNSTGTNSYSKVSKLLRIIVDFEMGKIDSLEYSIKSAYRYLHKRLDTSSKSEVLILNFLRTQLKHQQKREQVMFALKKLKNTLKKLEKDRFERSFLSDFDYISWIESKIKNRSFAEVVREKAAKKMLFN